MDDGKEGKHDITVDYKEYHQAIDVREKIEKPETIHFPVEILENILSRLSLIDLLTSACLVCKQWNQVITIDPSMVYMPCLELDTVVQVITILSRNLSCSKHSVH